MGRPLRIQYPGAQYHLWTRGVDGRPIFRTVAHRLLVLRLVTRVVGLDEWIVHAFCLMTNHLHLLVETPRGNLAGGAHRFLSHYAREFNATEPRRGHLFENRYGARLIRNEQQFLTTARYIVRNPVEARLCRRPEDWRWSSYRATAGLAHRPAFLTTGPLLELLDPRPPVARALYRTLCDEPLPRSGKIAA
jgi:REP element-mobilizing transposase RayT